MVKYMRFFEFLILLLFIGSSLLINFKTAIARLGLTETEQELLKYPVYYSFLIWLRRLKSIISWDYFLEIVAIYIQIYRLLFAILAAYDLFLVFGPSATVAHFSLIFISVIALMVILELSMRILAILFPLYSLKFVGFICGLMMILLLPFVYPIILLQQIFTKKQECKHKITPSTIFKTKLQEFIQHLDPNQAIFSQEKKLLLAVAAFRDRIAREIMVPRINVYSISTDKSIEECAKEFTQEGYSRIPVYDQNVDNIIGVILSKDILDYLTKSFIDPQLYSLTKSIKLLVKPVLFCPETKKISNLLQEFKSSQIHLAIVVDEYGGTEGIVTIEDILEVLVGEIEDEYDTEEEHHFVQDPNGGYTTNAKTSLIDLENEIGIHIPTSPNYDTIGGFIVNEAGFIPKKGWKIHHDTFYLEVLSSDEKSINKVRIIRTFPSN